MKRLSLSLAVAAVACWAASGAGAATFKGAVVGSDSARHTIAVASPGGVVRTVRVTRLQHLGARVSVGASRRPDGTFRAGRVTASGRVRHARIHGVVVRRAKARTFLSAGGTVLAVRSSARSKPGRVVTFDVSIKKDGLHGTKIIQSGQTGLIEIEGAVATLSPLAITIEHGATIQLTVPAALTLPAGLAVGDQVQAVVSFADGVYTLVTIETDASAEQGGGGGGDHAGEVETKGTVTALSADHTSLTVQPSEGGGTPVTFAVPAGFDLSGVQVGSKVEAKGTMQNGVLTLTKLKLEDQGGHNGGEVEAEGAVTALSADHTSLTVQPKQDGEDGSGAPVTFVVPAGFDLSGVQVGSEVDAKGTVQNGVLTLTELELKDQGDDGEDNGNGSGGDNGGDQGGDGGGGDGGH